ncbi:MAG: undecaprenyldiphospho-muramoylpentapeptide beta-N-acetylglucosaminyltransferase [Rickettsiales bacterium]
MKKTKILLVTGGTGGHIIPAVSLYEEAKKRGYEVCLSVDRRFLQFRQYFSDNLNYHVVASDKLSGSIFRKMIGVFKLILGFLQSIKLILIEKPSIVIGFGGYTTFATLLAAKFLRKPVLVHEQNSVMGNANYTLSDGLADLVLTAFPDVKNIHPKAKTKYIGNFVRKEIRESATELPDLKKNGEVVVTILGGSQGASILSEVVPKALAEFSKESKFKLQVFHQAREEDIERVRRVYVQNEIKCEVEKFFNDVNQKISKSHLIICRSGASTIFDLTFLGRAPILIPIPYSYKNHQLLNAQFIEKNKAGWIIEQKDFTSKKLAERLDEIFADFNALKTYSRNMLDLKKDGFDSIFTIIKNYCAN